MCKVLYERPKDLLIYGENICAFPHILGSPESSYMTLHPVPSEFPYICLKFCFLFYQYKTEGLSCSKAMNNPPGHALGESSLLRIYYWDYF